jgi:acyl-CoA dehydrogenase
VIDTATVPGRCFVAIAGAIAQMQRELKAERVAAGRAVSALVVYHASDETGVAWPEVLDLHARETRLYKTAPVHNNLVLAYIGQHVLGMPRSY